MYGKKTYPFITISKKVAVYLRLRGNIKETRTDKLINARNPKGYIRFIYDDRETASRLMESYNNDTEFHKFYECHFEVMTIVHGKSQNYI